MRERASFRIKQGETFSASSFFALWDEESQTKINYDLTGCSLFAQLRTTPDESGPVLVTLEIGSGFMLAQGIVPEAAAPNPPTDPNGWIATIPCDTTTSLPYEVTYFYDVFVTFPDGTVDCLQSVTLTIEATTGANGSGGGTGPAAVWGAEQAIMVTFETSSATSDAEIPANAIVVRQDMTITQAFPPGVSPSVGYPGATIAFGDGSQWDASPPILPFTTPILMSVPIGSTPQPVVVTVPDSPGSGAGYALTYFVIPRI